MSHWFLNVLRFFPNYLAIFTEFYFRLQNVKKCFKNQDKILKIIKCFENNSFNFPDFLKVIFNFLII